ncbi:unnamed protein product [Hyaloperonospora brassicae]|uniref:Uncharacterized protein n=1 Tax=Hyaloperonospora brassicae TaxID=162125 RepID=A0AAV0UT78_HYABA|nr:unnamed protein product [Hyaloperonospora brassicae]
MFAVHKHVKKHHSFSSMSSENSSSPWNVAPAVSPESATPWAVSPFQTRNPFKSPVKSSLPTETEPEPDSASHAAVKDVPSKEESTPVLAAAFEPASKVESAEKRAASSSVWAVPPVVEAEQTPPPSAWTSAVPVAAEEVKETSSALAKEVCAPDDGEAGEEVKESNVKHDESKVRKQIDDDTTGAETVEEASASAWTTAPVQAKAESKPAVVEPAAEEESSAEEAEVSDDSLGDSPVAVTSVMDPPAPMVDEFVVLHNEAADEGTSVSTSDGSWTTESVQEEAPPAATEVGNMPKESVSATETAGSATKAAVVCPAVADPAAADAAVADPSVANTVVGDSSVSDPAVAKAEEESSCIDKASSETSSAWTVAPTQTEKSEATLCTPAPVRDEVTPATVARLVSVVKAAKPAVPDTSDPAAAASKSMVKVHVTEDAPSTSAWNTTPVEEGVLKTDVPITEDSGKQKPAAFAEAKKVEPITPPAKEVAVAAEKDTPSSSSTWNATPVREEVKAGTVKKSTEPAKKAGVVQKHAIVDDKTTNVTKETPVAAAKGVVIATEVVSKDSTIDKKAIANAFDGVASYEANSVAHPKKAPSVEAAITRPADVPGACGACGIGGCSIQ